MKTTWTQIKSLIDEIMASPEIHYDDVTRLHDELLVPLQQKSEDFEEELRERYKKTLETNFPSRCDHRNLLKEILGK